MSALQLYIVIFDVKLKPEHPLFFKAGDGEILIWIYGTSELDAAEKGAVILSCLPYERSNLRASTSLVDKIWKKYSTDEHFRKGTELAKEGGFFFRLETDRLESRVPDIK